MEVDSGVIDFLMSRITKSKFYYNSAHWEKTSPVADNSD